MVLTDFVGRGTSFPSSCSKEITPSDILLYPNITAKSSCPVHELIELPTCAGTALHPTLKFAATF